MQNSFEKQVQDKMEELRFQPTDPVWLKVEAQIRKKKERRRFIFWLFPLLLAGGGGIFWMLQDGTAGKPVAAKSKQAGEAAQQKATPPVTNEERNIVALPPIAGEKMNEKTEEAPVTPDTPGNAPPLTKTAIPVALNVERKNAGRKAINTTDLRNTKPINVVEETPAVAIQPAKKDPPSKESEINQLLANRMPNKNVVPFHPGDSGKGTAKDTPAIRSLKTGTDSSKSIPKDSTVAPAVVKKEAPSSKWIFGARAAAGIAGAVSGFDVFAEEREYSFDPTSSGGSAGPGSMGSQPVRNSLYFSAGIEAGKTISPRLQLVTGLQYHYYSTTVKVGQLLRQDTVISNGGMLDQFYSNTGGSFSDYTNRYHFMALPLSLQWQVHRRVPLYLEGGFSVQQLLSTNALVFDPVAKIYYSDEDALNKTNFFAHAGLSYAVFARKGMQLRLGPVMQYGLSRISRNGSDKHLVSLGLSAALQFQK